MTTRVIRVWPDEDLKAISPKFDITEDPSSLIGDLIDTMIANLGMGIAAPQIGVLSRVLVIDCAAFGIDNPCPSLDRSNILVMINPEYLYLSDNLHSWQEACLSVPGYAGDVKRHKDCRVSFFDANKKFHELEFRWPLAGVVQHEIDHLDGKVFFQRMLNKRQAGRIQFDLYGRMHPTKTHVRRSRINRNKAIRENERS